jgi:hypothetical protein
VGWLHRLSNHANPIIAQSVQVYLVSELGGESFKGLSRVVLAAVETTVYEGLDATLALMGMAAYCGRGGIGCTPNSWRGNGEQGQAG